MTEQLTKQCRKCEQELPIIEFSKHSGTKDKLDNRCKSCVKKVKKNVERERKPYELDILETDITNENWQGGKKQGCCLKELNDHYELVFKNYPNIKVEKNLPNATLFLYDKASEYGLVKNRYKIIYDEITKEPKYLIVQLSKNFVTLCDYDQLEFIKSHSLFVTISGGKNLHKKHYCAFLNDDKNISFHKHISGFDMTDHINKYSMDNRKCNLRKATYTENNRNRTNYNENSNMTGITFSSRDESWRGRIKINNIEYKKEFSVSVYGYEEAKKRAIEYRK
jgi:hypothetical protein